ncbi:MAG: PD-(D/E)XK nuclease family protein [Candidatus Planktophila sp.]|jgi:putative RecB family exonuclease|tara:strand:+ start:520 stop:1275 length:756 start_codon:yes stop_codon:yes gene_type:complete
MSQLRLSPSRISDFNNCPQLYKYRTIDLLPEPGSIDAERGRLIHSVLEDLFDLPATERDLEHASQMLPGRWQSQIAAHPAIGELVLDESAWFKRAEELLGNYFKLEKPNTFEATHREMHLEMDLSENLYLHGYVDRLDIAPTGEVRIVDYKTGKSPKSGWEEKALFQLRVYALLYWKNQGVIPKLLQLIYLGDSRLIRSIPTEAQLIKTERVLFDIADEILRAIEKNEFRPRPTRLCDWCFFKTICPAHND